MALRVRADAGSGGATAWPSIRRVGAGSALVRAFTALSRPLRGTGCRQVTHVSTTLRGRVPQHGGGRRASAVWQSGARTPSPRPARRASRRTPGKALPGRASPRAVLPATGSWPQTGYTTSRETTLLLRGPARGPPARGCHRAREAPSETLMRGLTTAWPGAMPGRLRATGLHNVDARVRRQLPGRHRIEVAGSTLFDIGDVGVSLSLDVGKSAHHGHGLTPAGRKVFDNQLPNSEPTLRGRLRQADGKVRHRTRHRRPARLHRPAAPVPRPCPRVFQDRTSC